MFPRTFESRASSAFIEHGHEITSSLPLQMCLYFNVILFPFWVAMTVTMLHLKLPCLNSIYQFIIILIMVCLTLVEVVRLYLGYLGNLSEKVTDLAGFWVLSVVLQLPLHCFLIFCPPFWPLPGEFAMEGVMLSLLSAEVVSGFFALKKSARHQARQYHMQHVQNITVSPQPLLTDGMTTDAACATTDVRVKSD